MKVQVRRKYVGIENPASSIEDLKKLGNFTLQFYSKLLNDYVWLYNGEKEPIVEAVMNGWAKGIALDLDELRDILELTNQLTPVNLEKAIEAIYLFKVKFNAHMKLRPEDITTPSTEKEAKVKLSEKKETEKQLSLFELLPKASFPG